jgi:hypothetical protein
MPATSVQTSQIDGEGHVRVFPALKERGRAKSNIWIFDSPKNNHRFIIKGDVAFMHLVLAEGDTQIRSYMLKPLLVDESPDKGSVHAHSNAEIYFVNGDIELWEFQRSGDAELERKRHKNRQRSTDPPGLSAEERSNRVRNDLELKGKEILFDNWLLLCAAITRCKHQMMDREADALARRLRLHRSVRFGELLDIPKIDQAHILAVTAMSLQKGLLKTDLEQSLFGLDSVLTRGAAWGEE